MASPKPKLRGEEAVKEMEAKIAEAQKNGILHRMEVMFEERIAEKEADRKAKEDAKLQEEKRAADKLSARRFAFHGGSNAAAILSLSESSHATTLSRPTTPLAYINVSGLPDPNPARRRYGWEGTKTGAWVLDDDAAPPARATHASGIDPVGTDDAICPAVQPETNESADVISPISKLKYHGQRHVPMWRSPEHQQKIAQSTKSNNRLEANPTRPTWRPKFTIISGQPLQLDSLKRPSMKSWADDKEEGSSAVVRATNYQHETRVTGVHISALNSRYSSHAPSEKVKPRRHPAVAKKAPGNSGSSIAEQRKQQALARDETKKEAQIAQWVASCLDTYRSSSRAPSSPGRPTSAAGTRPFFSTADNEKELRPTSAPAIRTQRSHEPGNTECIVPGADSLSVPVPLVEWLVADPEILCHLTDVLTPGLCPPKHVFHGPPSPTATSPSRQRVPVELRWLKEERRNGQDAVRRFSVAMRKLGVAGTGALAAAVLSGIKRNPITADDRKAVVDGLSALKTAAQSRRVGVLQALTGRVEPSTIDPDAPASVGPPDLPVFVRAVSKHMLPSPAATME